MGTGTTIYWHSLLDSVSLLKLALAVLFGGVIGAERELRGRPAGLRTMSLVCMGSTLVVMAATQLPPMLVGAASAAALRLDPGRITAGVLTGIGFLGGGVILRLSDVIRGVTTAAAIWFVAALGIVIGQGYFGLALTATGFGMVVLWFFQYLERPLHGQIYPTVHLLVAADRVGTALPAARELLARYNMRVMDLKAAADNSSGITELHLFVRTQQHFQAHEVVAALAALDGVQHARWR